MKIKKDKNNIRIHTEESSKAVNKSLKDLGAGRSILIDADNTLIGGEGVMNEAEKLGIKVRIIDSDGSELIAVRRTDLKYSDPKRKALALADNRCHDLSKFDTSKIAGAFMECADFIEATGFSQNDIQEFQAFNSVMADLVENNFSNTVKGLSDIFSITFNFDKKTESIVGDFINSSREAKNLICKMIVDFCRKEIKNA